jgi:diguanylate cyclase (GGDEF)-like protein
MLKPEGPVEHPAAPLRPTMTYPDLIPKRRRRDIRALKRLRHRGPIIRAALLVFLLVGSLLVALVITLTRNADHTNKQQVGTELTSSARVASSSFAAVRADLRAQAGQLATSLDLQRAIVANDTAAIAQIAKTHHARIHARGRTFGSLAGQPRVASTATIAQGSAVLARVTLALTLDKRMLDFVRAATPLPTNGALLLVRNDRIIAGGKAGTPVTLTGDHASVGTTVFMAKASRLAVADATVLAIEPMAAVDARGVPYQRKVMLLALLTLALAAGVAARLGRPLAQMFGELSEQAETDALTGLPNRRTIDARLAEEFDRARRHGTHLTFVLVDIDNFKDVNDQLGHQFGDDVLRSVAPVLAGSLRALDLAGRFGGEEFALILPGTPLVAGRRVADQIRKTLSKVSFGDAERGIINVTASFGVAEFPECSSIEELIERADKALYRAKRAGKNCVVAGDQEPATPKPRTRAKASPAVSA